MRGLISGWRMEVLVINKSALTFGRSKGGVCFVAIIIYSMNLCCTSTSTSPYELLVHQIGCLAILSVCLPIIHHPDKITKYDQTRSDSSVSESKVGEFVLQLNLALF